MGLVVVNALDMEETVLAAVVFVVKVILVCSDLEDGWVML